MEICDPLGQIVMKGYLCKLKQGMFGKNVERYFVLTSRGDLKYFKDNQNFKPLGRIKLLAGSKIAHKNKTITLDKVTTDKND